MSLEVVPQTREHGPYGTHPLGVGRVVLRKRGSHGQQVRVKLTMLAENMTKNHRVDAVG